MRRTRWGAALAVLGLHASLLGLLLKPGGRSAPPQAAALPVRLLSLPAPKPLAPAARPAAPQPSARPALRLPPPRVAPAPATAPAALPAPTDAAAAVAPPLDLRLPATGPQAQTAARADSLAGLAERLRRDPRANSPRMSLEERFAMALGTPCFVEELNADGEVQRFTGQWVAQPTLTAQISRGVAANLGVGGKAPPSVAFSCQRK